MTFFEMNFDGLVGPTHNYAGLSFGNVASQNNAKLSSNPKQAALQGLQKMLTLHQLGFKQGILAPQARPDLCALRQMGFTGSDADIVEKAYQTDPVLLASVYSASSMWTANAATVTPSPDSGDNKVHFTPANLINQFHRSIEVPTTSRILQRTFTSPDHFVHHPALPHHPHFGDEGAANHTRLSSHYAKPGVGLFVYGDSASDNSITGPQKYPARQTLEASQAVARAHQLNPQRVIFAQQNPDVIDAGVFHNDVIAVGNQNVLFYHEEAFAQRSKLEQKLGDMIENFEPIMVPNDAVSVENAVKSYLFNTQLLTRHNHDGRSDMMLVAPTECQENEQVKHYLADLVTMNNAINHVEFIDVKQSMQNGGGPACLRLRVTMNEAQYTALNQATVINEQSFAALSQWVEKHYRDSLSLNDLRDPSLIKESYCSLDELTQLLQLGSVYDFQRDA